MKEKKREKDERDLALWSYWHIVASLWQPILGHTHRRSPSEHRAHILMPCWRSSVSRMTKMIQIAQFVAALPMIVRLPAHRVIRSPLSTDEKLRGKNISFKRGKKQESNTESSKETNKQWEREGEIERGREEERKRWTCDEGMSKKRWHEHNKRKTKEILFLMKQRSIQDAEFDTPSCFAPNRRS